MRIIIVIIFLITIIFLFRSQIKIINNQQTDILRLEHLLPDLNTYINHSETIHLVSNNSNSDFIYNIQFLIAPRCLNLKTPENFRKGSLILAITDERAENITVNNILAGSADTLWMKYESPFSAILLKIH